MINLAVIDYQNLTKEECLSLYKQIIRYRKKEKLSQYNTYCDKHHIIPKWICKDRYWKEHESNYVYLLIHEHFICHYLLYKYLNDGYSMASFVFFLLGNKTCDFGNMSIDVLNIYESALKYENVIKKGRTLKKKKRGNHTLEELYGEERAKEIRIKANIVNERNKGKTNLEIYGEKRAKEISEKIKKGMQRHKLNG